MDFHVWREDFDERFKANAELSKITQTISQEFESMGEPVPEALGRDADPSIEEAHVKPTGCVFCEIVAGRATGAIVWENPEFVAFLDHRPIQLGHLLLVPREHIDYLFDLEASRYQSLWDCARSLAAPLREATGADRIGIAVEGYGVPHLHVHLVPLNGLGDLDPCKQHRVAREDLDRMAGQIRSSLQRIDILAPDEMR